MMKFQQKLFWTFRFSILFRESWTANQHPDIFEIKFLFDHFEILPTAEAIQVSFIPMYQKKSIFATFFIKKISHVKWFIVVPMMKHFTRFISFRSKVLGKLKVKKVYSS